MLDSSPPREVQGKFTWNLSLLPQVGREEIEKLELTANTLVLCKWPNINARQSTGNDRRTNSKITLINLVPDIQYSLKRPNQVGPGLAFEVLQGLIPKEQHKAPFSPRPHKTAGSGPPQIQVKQPLLSVESVENVRQKRLTVRL